MCDKFKLIILFCAVVKINCYNEYTRIKRAKYYNSPPFKFYKPPPYSPPIRGPFSYTPPPSYTAPSANDISPYSPNLRPYKVSKRPGNEGLGDEDIINLFKYLSKKDLDKIVEYAYERDKLTERYKGPPSSNYEYPSPEFGSSDSNVKDQNYESNRYSSLNSGPSEVKYNFEENPNVKYVDTQYQETVKNYQTYTQTPVKVENSFENDQFAFLDAHIKKVIKETNTGKDIYTDNTNMQEEQLPKPLNLRQEDYEVSYTNNVPSVAKPEATYKHENFADLPLMDYVNSKLHSVDSYKVPHYSVTSSGKQNPKPSLIQPSISSSLLSSSSSSQHINAPAVEPAPPVSVAKEQSDAHLKATRIWTHKSKGTAYTLHDDGTLTLEKPSLPHFKLY